MQGSVAVGVIAGTVVVAGITGLVIAMVRVPAGVDIDVEGDEIVVRPRGLDVLWTLRRRVAVPVAAVGMVRVVAARETPHKGIRLPGASLPGFITAGSFGTGDERDFWDVRRAGRVLMVTCRPGYGYRALVVEVPDPDAAARRLQAALAVRP